MKKLLVLLIGLGVCASAVHASDRERKEKKGADTKTKVIYFEKDKAFTRLVADNNAHAGSLLFKCEKGGLPDKCCPYWDNGVEQKIELVIGWIPVRVLKTWCKTGGDDQCRIGECSELQKK